MLYENAYRVNIYMTQYLFQTTDSYSDLDEAAQGIIDHQPNIRPT